MTPSLPWLRSLHQSRGGSRFRLLTMTSPEAVLDNLAERLTLAHQHTLASEQQPAYNRSDDHEQHRHWHDDHYGRDVGLSR